MILANHFMLVQIVAYFRIRSESVESTRLVTVNRNDSTYAFVTRKDMLQADALYHLIFKQGENDTNVPKGPVDNIIDG